MQNFRTVGLIIKKVRDLFNLSDKYGKIIQCDTLYLAGLDQVNNPTMAWVDI